MGKKNRKTRWRTLTITDEHSDCEESTTTSSPRLPNTYQQKSFYSRFTYSSQSTPTRRYQYDGTKSTRSSSTASENKITFNEDEYTRITTPRQDVLFKKGYLNKPKTYQTQTSTGTSTTSTGNSTGNGTPDHQSTDLEYESQFVFPNGFVDQNGVYYVNSYEPYPLMLYNPPTYYPEFSNVKSKRCSTGSLTESTSPHNEEVSQDQNETPSNVSDFNHVYNVVYPGFYFSNGTCQPQDAVDESEPRRPKKKKKRKVSHSTSATQEGTTSEYTDVDDDGESSDEVFSGDRTPPTPNPSPEPNAHAQSEEEETNAQVLLLKSLIKRTDAVKEQLDKIAKEASSNAEQPEAEAEEPKTEEEGGAKDEKPSKYDLKPDAEEFVPRAYRQPETIPVDPGIQFIKIPPNFMPVPILNPMGEFNGQINHPAFMPPGIPINFIPQNYVNIVPGYAVDGGTKEDVVKEEETKETVEVPKVGGGRIDIAKIVSKLEKAAKEQDSVDDGKVETKATTDKAKEESAPPRFQTRNINSGGATDTHRTHSSTTSHGTNGPGDSRKINDTTESHSSSTDSHRTNGTVNTHPANHRVNDVNERPRLDTHRPNGAVEHPRTNGPKDSSRINGFVRSFKNSRYQNHRNEENQRNTVNKFDTDSRRRPIWKQPTSPRKDITNGVGANKNYSETLKKPQNAPTQCDRFDKNMERSNSMKAAEVKKETSKLPNQWISVSSKKKRKNRNVEETDDFGDVEDKEKDLFENYDVNLLEDVVVKNEGTVIKPTETVAPVPVKAEQVEAPVVEVVLKPAKDDEDNQLKIAKKKSKKNQKPATKRVMITDVDMSSMAEIVVVGPKLETDEVPPVDKVDEKSQMQVVEKIGNKIADDVVEKTVAEFVDKLIVEEVKNKATEAPEEVEEKKDALDKRMKRKKKKAPKPGLVSSQSSSSTTLNVADDSYDFLLETSLLDESAEKTNLEMSQELDRMIQRGMYSSLEEKIRSLNMSESNDGFFKTIIGNISSRESSVEKNSFMRAPDYGLKSTGHLVKPASVEAKTVPPASATLDVLLSQPSPDEVCLILEQVASKEIISNEPKGLYPITQAVREWMTKTRENTPEVEILKSPSTIFKEFCQEEGIEEEEKEETDQKNADGNSFLAGSHSCGEGVAATTVPDEATICSFSREGSVDLLQCWEDQPVAPETESKTVRRAAPAVEDQVEFYDSRYGKNEDYLRIRAEVEDQKRNATAAGAHPKHGNLPYRAICCSIM